MLLTNFIAPNSVVPLLKAKSKKQLLQDLSARAARITGIPERDIFDVLLQRERLGSTGLGHGVAIPHGKLQGLKRIAGVFARLAEPIDRFDHVKAVVHGHAHHGTYEGRTPLGKPVYNCAQFVLRPKFGRPYALIEV